MIVWSLRLWLRQGQICLLTLLKPLLHPRTPTLFLKFLTQDPAGKEREKEKERAKEKEYQLRSSEKS